MSQKDDLISRQAVFDMANGWTYNFCDPEDEWAAMKEIRELPSAEPEKTEYIPENKAIPTARSCVDLAEKVTATFYDEEHEKWTQRTVTIADILDSVCDAYTILPSAEPEIIRCTECKHYREYDSEYVENAVVVQCMADRYPISKAIPDGWFCAGAERRTDG